MNYDNQFEPATTGALPDDDGQQVLTPYGGRETVERMMTGMMQEMAQGAERSGRRSIRGTADMLRLMGCDDGEIRERLVKEYGVNPEEADSLLPPPQ